MDTVLAIVNHMTTLELVLWGFVGWVICSVPVGWVVCRCFAFCREDDWLEEGQGAPYR